MIALVGLTRGDHDAGFIEIESLPRPPALKYSGFLIQCSPAPDGLIEWLLEVRGAREHLPIGGVVNLGDPFLFLLAESGVQLRPLLPASEIADATLPTTVLNRFRGATIEGLILEAWQTERKHVGHDSTPEAERFLAAAVGIGMTGAGVPTLARCLDLKRSVIYRRFEELGLPPPGAALRRARHEALRIALEKFGMDRAIACNAGGWLTPRAYAKARYRHRRRGMNQGTE